MVTSIPQPSFAAGKVLASPLKSPVLLSGPGKYQVTGLAFSPDGRKLAAVNGFGLLHQWRLEDSILLGIDQTYRGSVIYSPNNRILAIWQHTAAFYQAQNNQLLYILGNHVGSLKRLWNLHQTAVH